MLRRFKCVLSAALVAVLLFTLFPLASFAADPSIKFSVTKYTLTPEELEEIEPDKEEDVGNYADLYPVPLIVRVAVGGSGKLVGADFTFLMKAISFNIPAPLTMIQLLTTRQIWLFQTRRQTRATERR